MAAQIGKQAAIQSILNLNSFVRAGGNLASASRVARETLFFVLESGNTGKYRCHRHSLAAAVLPSHKGTPATPLTSFSFAGQFSRAPFEHLQSMSCGAALLMEVTTDELDAINLMGGA